MGAKSMAWSIDFIHVVLETGDSNMATSLLILKLCYGKVVERWMSFCFMRGKSDAQRAYPNNKYAHIIQQRAHYTKKYGEEIAWSWEDVYPCPLCREYAGMGHIATAKTHQNGVRYHHLQHLVGRIVWIVRNKDWHTFRCYHVQTECGNYPRIYYIYVQHKTCHGSE